MFLRILDSNCFKYFFCLQNIFLSKENSARNDSNEINNKNNFNNLTKEEKIRIEELRLMKIKCFTYPLVTIIIWLCIATYRFVDDLSMMDYDKGDPREKRKSEKNYFKSHHFQLFCVEFFLVVHTFLSATRGIFYGFSFIVFEEKIFFNFFKKIWMKYLRDDNLKLDEEEEKNMIRNTYNSSSIGEYNLKEEQKDDNYSNIEMNRNSNTNTNTNYDNETT